MLEAHICCFKNGICSFWYIVPAYCTCTRIHLCLHIVQLYIEALCHGNLLEGEAINISSIFKSNFSLQPLPVSMRHEEHVICLPFGANLVRDVNVKNKSETNSVVEVAEN